jgi:predicted O-linked N-acetylglucosamine transferase (SPINDLY family)
MLPSMPTTTDMLLFEAASAFESGDFTLAISKLDEVDSIDHSNWKSLHTRAMIYYRQGCIEDAIHALERCVLIVPGNDEMLYTLAMFYGFANNPQKSFETHQKVIKINPDHSRSLINLGSYFGKAGKFKESIICFKRASELSPTDPAIFHNCGNIFKEMSLLSEAVQYYRKALELQPNMEGTASTLCYLSNFMNGSTFKSIYESHKKWGDKFANYHKSAWPKHTNPPDQQRKIRVAFISEDFRKHTVGVYLLPVFEKLDSSIFKICYSLKVYQDDITARFDKSADMFVNCSNMSVIELKNRIMQDEVDVVFDLSGHTSGNRLSVLALKPAPIQMTWLGYAGTIGMDAIDYKISSHMSVPTGADRYYVEKVLRFPSDMPHQCFLPLDTVDITGLPYDRNGYITFGSVSSPAKLNQPLLKVWSNILHSIPNSRLLLKAGTLVSEYLQDIILKRLGMEAEKDRVIFQGFSPHSECLKVYNDIDIALDPWPFSGCTTTCEALWMGVPVVTKPGETEASRHSVSFISSLGDCVDLIAVNEAQYCDIACSLASNIDRLRSLRQNLRGKLLSSPISDASRFGAELSKLMRSAWVTWCKERNVDEYSS